MGLVECCVADAELDAELAKVLAAILANSWHSNRTNKRLLIDTDATPLNVGLAHEDYRSAGFGPDFKARITRLLNKGNASR